MTPPIGLVIFDCDGVLVDSEPLAVRVDVRVLAELGWELSEQQVIERFVGRSDASFVAEIEAHLGRRLPPDWEEPFQHLYRDVFAAELTPVDGVVEALDQIKLPTCIASSARGKPAPDLFLHAAAQMGVDPPACVVVEDSRYGVEAARAAGMRALGFAGGLTPAERLQGPRTLVFSDMRKLPSLLADTSWTTAVEGSLAGD
jgi:beta-phosphoglucomutase-like phosphatase (HAD superfamily)